MRLVGDPSFGAATRDVVLASAAPIRNVTVKPAAAEGPRVFVGRGSAAELANIDIKGKIAVVNVVPDDSLCAAREKGLARELEKLGAIGVINAVESPGNLFYYDNSYGCAAAPCFLLGGDDGAFLESVIGKAARAGETVTVRLALKGEERGSHGLERRRDDPRQEQRGRDHQRPCRRLVRRRRRQRRRAFGDAGLADHFAHRKAKPTGLWS